MQDVDAFENGTFERNGESCAVAAAPPVQGVVPISAEPASPASSIVSKRSAPSGGNSGLPIKINKASHLDGRMATGHSFIFVFLL